jgi:hypothetical protein
MSAAWLSRVVANQGAAEFRLPPDELDAISFEGFSVRARCSEFLPFPHQLADPVSQAIDIGLGMDGGHLQRMRLSPCSSHVESARKSPDDADEFPTAPVWKTRGLWKVRQYQIATEEPDTTSGGSGSEQLARRRGEDGAGGSREEGACIRDGPARAVADRHVDSEHRHVGGLAEVRLDRTTQPPLVDPGHAHLWRL